MKRIYDICCAAQDFWADESGAATVEWVVGAAAAVSISMAVTSAVGSGVEAMSNKIADTLSNFEFNFESQDPNQTVDGTSAAT